MLTRSERHLTETEREQIDQQLKDVEARIKDAGLKIALIVFLDLLCVMFGAAACLQGDRSGPLGIVAGLAAITVANIVLVLSQHDVVQGRRYCAQLLRAKLHDTTVVERIEASEAVCLRVDKCFWGILNVDEERLIAISCYEWYIPRSPESDDPAGLFLCFEHIVTKADRLHLATVPLAGAVLPHPPVTDLWRLVPDPTTRRRVAARLATATGFPGRLDRLAESLAALACA